jgi:hypothetical protein
LPGDAPDTAPSGRVDVKGVAVNVTPYVGTPDTYHG